MCSNSYECHPHPRSTYDTHFVASPRRNTACSDTSGHLIAENAVYYNGGMHEKTAISPADCRTAAFPILADTVDVKTGDQLCETVSQPSIWPDKVDQPMGS